MRDGDAVRRVLLDMLFQVDVGIGKEKNPGHATRFLACRDLPEFVAPRKPTRHGAMAGAPSNLFQDHPDAKRERAADPGSAGADGEAAASATRFLRSRGLR